MGKFRYGVEPVSWVMSGDKYIGECPHICEVIKRAGFTGIEPSARLMGRYFDDPSLMSDLLEKEGLRLAAQGFGGRWRGSTLSEEELVLTERVFGYVSSFPEPRITLGHGSADRSALVSASATPSPASTRLAGVPSTAESPAPSTRPPGTIRSFVPRMTIR